MPTGSRMVELARQHVGEDYRNVLVPKNNANWHGPWDCAEFMSWLVFQEANILYGCVDSDADPALVEAYTGAWKTDSARRGIRIPANKAAAIVGGFLLRFPPSPGKMGHIAICDGQGGTVEAKSRREGVVEDTVRGRRWDTGVLVPGVTYDQDVVPISLGSVKVVRLGANNDPAVVRNIQRALDDAGIDAGGVDGKYGPKTTAAVAAFQRLKGLVMDGEVGPETARVLEIEL
jgi:N-acetylmuramoyl-L-alanine amidase